MGALDRQVDAGMQTKIVGCDDQARPEVRHAVPVQTSGAVSPQKAEKLDAFSQPAFRHVPATKHFADNFPYLAWAEVEAFVEDFDAMVNFLLGQMGITDGRQLHSLLIDQV